MLSKVKKKSENPKVEADGGFDVFVSVMNSDISTFWSSVEAFEAYRGSGGSILSRTTFIDKLLLYYDEKLLIYLAVLG